MHNNSKLVIAIPTYNRVATLSKLLTKIIPHLNKDLSLLIIDNCSVDETSKYCLSVSDNPYIKYIKNKINVGGVVNMLKCIEFSNGDYTWLLGDDDDIDTNYLEELVENIKDHKCVGYHLVPYTRRHINVKKTKFINKKEFVNEFYDISTYNIMSTGIYKTEEVQKFLKDAYKFVNLQHSFGLFFGKILENNQCIKILSTPILLDEQIHTKRWSKFVAHIDAIESSYIIFGKDVLNKEYNIRAKQLLSIAYHSLFLKKNEGFNSKNINRIFSIFGIRSTILVLTLKTMLLFSKSFLTRYLLIYLYICIFYLQDKNQYKNRISNKLDIQDDTCLVKKMYDRISNKKSDFFTN